MPRGRNPDGEKPTLTFRLDAKLYDTLQRAAHAERVSVNQWIRSAVVDELKRRLGPRPRYEPEIFQNDPPGDVM